MSVWVQLYVSLDVFLQANRILLNQVFDEVKKLGILAVFFCPPSVFVPLLSECYSWCDYYRKVFRALANCSDVSLDRQSSSKRVKSRLLPGQVGSGLNLRIPLYLMVPNSYSANLLLEVCKVEPANFGRWLIKFWEDCECTKFHEVLNCLHGLAKDNIKPRDPTFKHEKIKEDSSGFISKALLEL